ncbi:hypothetical protein HispidOSU_016721 [Sigmodon hispidus]
MLIADASCLINGPFEEAHVGIQLGDLGKMFGGLPLLICERAILLMPDASPTCWNTECMEQTPEECGLRGPAITT